MGHAQNLVSRLVIAAACSRQLKVWSMPTTVLWPRTRLPLGPFSSFGNINGAGDTIESTMAAEERCRSGWVGNAQCIPRFVRYLRKSRKPFDCLAVYLAAGCRAPGAERKIFSATFPSFFAGLRNWQCVGEGGAVDCRSSVRSGGCPEGCKRLHLMSWRWFHPCPAVLRLPSEPRDCHEMERWGRGEGGVRSLPTAPKSPSISSCDSETSQAAPRVFKARSGVPSMAIAKRSAAGARIRLRHPARAKVITTSRNSASGDQQGRGRRCVGFSRTTSETRVSGGTYLGSTYVIVRQRPRGRVAGGTACFTRLTSPTERCQQIETV